MREVDVYPDAILITDNFIKQISGNILHAS